MNINYSSAIIEELREFNALWKAQDDIWQEAAKRSGLPPTAFWIIYILTIESGRELTQTELCSSWFIPRQTCNSAVKKLEREGLVSLSAHKGAGNVKYLSLTDNGRTFADNNITPLADADIQSLSSFTEEERNILLTLMRRQLDYLRKGTEHIWK